MSSRFETLLAALTQAPPAPQPNPAVVAAPVAAVAPTAPPSTVATPAAPPAPSALPPIPTAAQVAQQERQTLEDLIRVLQTSPPGSREDFLLRFIVHLYGELDLKRAVILHLEESKLVLEKMALQSQAQLMAVVQDRLNTDGKRLRV